MNIVHLIEYCRPQNLCQLHWIKLCIVTMFVCRDASMYVCVHACMYALQIVSMDKILHFTNTFIIKSMCMTCRLLSAVFF